MGLASGSCCDVILLAAMASGSPIHKYSKERMHDTSVFVGLWQQVVSKIVPVMLLPDKFTDGLLSKVHDDASLQGGGGGSSWPLAAVATLQTTLRTSKPLLRSS